MEQPTLSDFDETQAGTPGEKTDPDDLLADIERLARVLGRVPNTTDVQERGRYSHTTYSNHFGSWSRAVELAGFENQTPNIRGNAPSDAEMLEELRRIDDLVSGPPRTKDNQKHGKFTHSMYYHRFGSWGDALREIGITPVRQYKHQDPVDVGKLVDELVRVTVMLGKPPTEREMRQHGDMSPYQYKNIFGSWSETLICIGLSEKRCSEENQHSTYGRNWAEMRDKALQRDRYRCQHCGLEYTEHKDEYGMGLHVHHLIPIKDFDTPEEANFLDNLITLCEECHRKWEPITQSSLLGDR